MLAGAAIGAGLNVAMTYLATGAMLPPSKSGGAAVGGAIAGGLGALAGPIGGSIAGAMGARPYRSLYQPGV